MSLINISFNVTAYADELKSTNPRVKYTDLSWSFLGLPTGKPEMVPVHLSPGETKTVMSLERMLSFTGGTSFTISQMAGTSNVRLSGTFGARTARLDGNGTTQWALTRSNTLVKAQYTGTGTAPTFAGMQVGDGITFESPFNEANQGDFIIVKVGVDFVEFVNGLSVDETVIGQVQIYSSGPVQVGDVLDLSSSQFVYPNLGQFKIFRVTDSFVEFSNPSAVPEVVTGVTAGLSIYPLAYQWMFIAIDHTCVVKTNADSGIGMPIEPIVAGDFSDNPGVFLKRGKVFRVDLTNPGIDVVEGVLFLAG